MSESIRGWSDEVFGCASLALTDKSLLEAFRHGDPSALELIYRQHVHQIESVVRKGLCRAHRYTAANVADIVQEVFVKAFSEGGRARYDGTRKYGPFLCAIAKNTLIDWLRCSRREISGHVDVDTLCDSAELVRNDCFPHELVAAARRYIRGLAPELRALHELRFAGGQGQESAARSLGISRQRLRTLERKLIEGLRSVIQTTPRPRS